MNIISKIVLRLSIILLSGYLPILIQFMANLIPIAGVLFFDWSIYDLVLIFICETFIILFFSIIKSIYLVLIDKDFLFMKNISSETIKFSSLTIFLSDVFYLIKNPVVAIILCSLIIFILIYSSLFFILLLFDSHFSINGIINEPLYYLYNSMNQNILIAIISLVISHLIAFIDNFLVLKEYHYYHPFSTPLKRNVILFLAMIIGIKVNEVFLESKLIYLITIIGLKMLTELSMLITERKMIKQLPG